MLKLLIAGRRCLSKSREDALDHLRRVHGPLVYDAPASAGAMPVRYVQNHVFDVPVPNALLPFVSDRDLVTELWFDDVAHFKAAIGTPYYLNRLRPDESNFVDQTTVLKSMVREGDLAGVCPLRAIKVFLFLKANAAGQVTAIDGECGIFFRTPAMALLVNLPLPTPDGLPAYADYIIELWFQSSADARRYLSDCLPAALDTLKPELDGNRSFFVVATEYTESTLRSVNDEQGAPTRMRR